MIWTCLLLHIAAYTAMIIIFYIFPTLFSSFGLIGGAHPNDHFANGQTGHFDHEHNNNLNMNNNNNIFGGYNNYNTGGGIVSSSGGTPPHHLNIGSSISRSNIISNTNGERNLDIINDGHNIDGIADSLSLSSSVSANIVAGVTDQNVVSDHQISTNAKLIRNGKYANLKFIESIGYEVTDTDDDSGDTARDKLKYDKKYFSKMEQQGATLKENSMKLLDTINSNKFISKGLSNSINIHLNKTLHDSNA